MKKLFHADIPNLKTREWQILEVHNCLYSQPITG